MKMNKPWRVDVLRCRGSSYDVGKQMGQLGTLDRRFDPTIRIPTKKTLARLSSIAVNK